MEFAAWEAYFIVACTLHPDAPTVGFHNSLSKCQAQPCTPAFETRFTGRVFGEFAGLIELAENNFARVRVHAHACIADDDLNASSWQLRVVRWEGFRTHSDAAFVGCEFNGVAQQVLEELFQKIWICPHHGQWRDVNRQCLFAFHERLHHAFSHLFYQRASIDRYQMDLKCTCIDLRDVEH